MSTKLTFHLVPVLALALSSTLFTSACTTGHVAEREAYWSQEAALYLPKGTS